jgi:hypothetical protein
MAHWLSKAIKHPGALTKAAAAKGVSKHQEAAAESHSANPHIRGRGLLGLRLMGGAFKKHKGAN